MKRILIALSLSCTHAGLQDLSQPTPQTPIPVPPKLIATTPREVRCADRSELPTAAVDLDGDGTRDRASAIFNGTNFDIRIYQVPSFRQIFLTTLRAEHVQLATTPGPTGGVGDLWVFAGSAGAKKEDPWVYKLYHLEQGKLQELSASSYREPNLTIDLDKDGHVDPVITEGGQTKILFTDRTELIEATPTPYELVGLPLPDGMQAPVDLDGDQDLDLLASSYSWVGVLDVKSKAFVWRRELSESPSTLVSWEGRPAILVGSEPSVLLEASSPQHKEIINFGSRAALFDDDAKNTARYVTTGLFVNLFGGALWRSGGEAIEFKGQLATPADLSRGPEPLPFFQTQQGVLESIQTEWGDPSMGGQGESKFTLALQTKSSTPKTLAKRTIPGEGDLRVSYFDFNGDGASEILLKERSGYMDCDLGGGGGSEQWSLLQGDGTLLYQDEQRSFDYSSNVYHDRTADVEVIDLGTSSRGLRLRTWNQEWWWLPEELSTKDIPACIE